MTAFKERLYKLYQDHEVKIDSAFFLGGFFFDLFTLAEIDNLFGISQQIVYLLVLGAILRWDFLATQNLLQVPKRLEKIWDYRQLVVHFLLGSLLSVYSLFFIKSASLFSSLIFIVLLLAVMVANELQRIRKGDISLKVALFVICVFSFFSMTVPVLLGFVGVVPFLLSLTLTGLFMYGFFVSLRAQVTNQDYLQKRLLLPSGSIIALFLVFYFLGWIPPVPLSIQSIGVYHRVEKAEGQYVASYETPSWKFWHHGDQNFVAEPGDTVFIFAQIFSPARFSDSVILHWYFLDPQAGWQTTDKIPMSITGGRKTGYRGFSSKQNYSEGRWRVSVETTDGREIGRIYFNVTKVAENNPKRIFFKEVF
ncbi:MAG: hypothetical protein OM95_01585 [Bdellovibrio sp. ArHS]|uniref:DUF2914 domain-containing protein n=1 Tax=Bdellovibrio sp. ArHS TaxID=1569284 RepID=UPI0005828FB8|nr:DUF2914 domain-containing protein [Bdellovibrio sp. ArHS]KHD89789.1 MAG: hypothetical protein OM95_01585 [Bdellovibrio sp. ArHS]